MGKLLDQALEPSNASRAWKRLRNDQAPWHAGSNGGGPQGDATYEILSLIDELRSGRYRPDRLRRFTIKKANGKERVLSALSLRDKLAQRMVLNVVEPIGEALFHNESYAYRPNRNVAMAHARAVENIRCGLPWLVDADIEGFFDHIPHRALRKQLKQYIPDREILHLMALWLDAAVPVTGIFESRRGIPQGAILSPFWCNLYLHRFDSALAAKNIPFVRYADDFLLFAKDEVTARKIFQFAERSLKQLDLRLHPQKSRVTLTGSNIIFLGKPLPKKQLPAR